MDNEINRIDDLLDDSIGKSLRNLGFIFPRSCADFNLIEEKLKSNPLSMPTGLNDPYKFLGKKVFQKKSNITLATSEYSLKLAQAAREGNEITDEVKQKMARDKMNSRKK